MFGLTRGVLDFLGQASRAVYGETTERITYHAKASPTADVVDYAEVIARFRDYRLEALNTGVVQLNDQECLIETALVLWTPGDYDRLTRANGTPWKVLRSTGGALQPYWHLHCRRDG